MKIFNITQTTKAFPINEQLVSFDLKNSNIITNPKCSRIKRNIWKIDDNNNIYTFDTNRKKVYLIGLLLNINFV